ncbi:MAG TPA: BON domain-containing protein [Vicinamibacterales bacterium]|nr:BON domain-containing protein [Vicinamibacterales bacterium]
MHRRYRRIAGVGVWLSLAMAAPVVAQSPATTTQSAPDNTKNNKPDQLSADSQRNGRKDLDITRDIRRAIVADKNLSTYAHNVKVITLHGEVTLKGPVRSEDERKAIEAKAIEVAGQGRVADELTIATPKGK